MARFHVNTNTGNTGTCKAAKGKCPFGGESGDDNHYSTPEEATKAAEQFMNEKYSTVNTAYRKKDNSTVNSLPRELKKRILKEASEGAVKLHPSVVAKVFSNDSDELVRKNVAETFKSQKILREMSNDESARVRLGVAQSTNNPEVLKALANDPDSKVRNAAIANPKMPVKSRKAVEKAAYEQKLANLNKGKKVEKKPKEASVNKAKPDNNKTVLKAANHKFTAEEKYEITKSNAEASYVKLAKNYGFTGSERKALDRLMNKGKISDRQADEILAKSEEIAARIERDELTRAEYNDDNPRETSQEVSKIIEYVKAARSNSSEPNTNRTLNTFDPAKETILSNKGQNNPYQAMKELDKNLKDITRYNELITRAKESNRLHKGEKANLRNAEIKEWSAKVRASEVKSLLVSKEIQYRAKNNLFDAKYDVDKRQMRGMLNLPTTSSKYSDVEAFGITQKS